MEQGEKMGNEKELETNEYPMGLDPLQSRCDNGYADNEIAQGETANNVSTETEEIGLKVYLARILVFGIFLTFMIGVFILLRWFIASWSRWITSSIVDRYEIPMILMSLLLSRFAVKGEKHKLFTRALFSYRIVVISDSWSCLVQIVTILAQQNFDISDTRIEQLCFLALAAFCLEWGAELFKFVVTMFTIGLVWVWGGAWVFWTLLFPVSVFVRVFNLITSYMFGVAPFFIYPTVVEHTPIMLSDTMNSVEDDIFPGKSTLEAAQIEMKQFSYCLNSLIRLIFWVLTYRVIRKHQRRRQIQTAYTTMRRNFRTRQHAISAGAHEATQHIWAMMNDRINKAKANPFHAKLHKDPKQFISAGLSSRDSSTSLSSLWNKHGDDIESIDDTSKLLKAQKSLRSQLGERAETLSHLDKCEQLKAYLGKLHGSPGLLQILFEKVSITVDRTEERSVFLQSAEQMIALPPNMLKNGLCIEFEGEYGTDAGGLTSEWFNILAQELSGAYLVNCMDLQNGSTILEEDDVPIVSSTQSIQNRKTKQYMSKDESNTAKQDDVHRSSLDMFRTLQDGTLMLKSNPKLESYYYLALGKILATAILLEQSIPLQLSSAMLKIITDSEITAFDIRALDPTYFKNRMLILLKPGGVSLMHEIMDIGPIPFQYMDNEGNLGEELCKNGRNTFLCESNKTEYIQLLSEHYLCGNVREQLQVLLCGFYEVVPKEAIAECDIDHVDLALLLSGMPEIDIHDWRTNTELPDFNKWEVTTSENKIVDVSSTDMMDWFWECITSMTTEERVRLLQFSTGSSQCPPGGFKNLKPRKFNVMVDPKRDHLVSAATCFNTLRLPLSLNENELKEKLIRVCMNKDFSTTFGDS